MAKIKNNTLKSTNSYAVSKYNSLSHGALSRLKILPWEDAEELEEIQNSFLEEHQPKGATEKYLVLELANIAFRKQRLYQAENALISCNLKNLSGYSFSNIVKTAKFLSKESCQKDEYENNDTLEEALYHNITSDNLEINERYQTIQHAQKLLESSLTYEEMLHKLNPNLAELWQDYLDDDEYDFISTNESLIKFLKEHVVKYNQEICASIKARPYVQQHAIASAYIPDERTETLQRYETSLDRKFERLLVMLLKLQSNKKENSLTIVNQASS